MPWRSCGAARTLFFELFPNAETRSNFDNREAFLQVHGGVIRSLLNALVLLETELGRMKDRPEEVNNLMRRAVELRQGFQAVLEGKERNMVYWWERRGRGVFRGGHAD